MNQSETNQATLDLLELFERISAIPRGSGHEAGMASWLLEWAADKGLNALRDQAGNVIVRVPASPGFEQAPVVVLQGHMDMVCQKTPDSAHQFDRDPIACVVDGDWLRADGTTLGADNGVALALGLYCASKQQAHPALELLFTIEEETGLIGAAGLEADLLQGRVLINLDSEKEGEFTVGCAGGNTVELDAPLSYTTTAKDAQTWVLSVHGVLGGHSGIDIHLPRANAIKLLARLLHTLGADARVCHLHGGTLHNAIPCDAHAVLRCAAAKINAMAQTVQQQTQLLRQEYGEREPNLDILFTPNPDAGGAMVWTDATQRRMIDLLLAWPHGVATMSAHVNGLVETSNNLAIVDTREYVLHLLSSQRGSLDSTLAFLNKRLEALARLARCPLHSDEGYPGWQPNMASPLLLRCKEVFQRCFNREPEIQIIHAGLECGVIGRRIGEMDMISIGPTIEHPHSPSERLHIPSLSAIWTFLDALLRSWKSV